MRSDAQLSGALGQRAAIHQLGAAFGERSFAKIRKFFIQLARQHELQHGIAEKFQALIGFERDALFVRDRWVCQGQLQQVGIMKFIT